MNAEAGPLVPKKLAATISRTRPAIAREARGDREDRRVAGHAAAARRRRGGRLLGDCFGGGGQGRYSTALRGALGRFVPRAAAASTWPTSIHRRSGSCAPSASALENRLYTSAIKTLLPPPARRRARAATQRPPRPTHRELVSTIDKAVKRGALHRNTGARKKSRAARISRRVLSYAAPAARRLRRSSLAPRTRPPASPRSPRSRAARACPRPAPPSARARRRSGAPPRESSSRSASAPSARAQPLGIAAGHVRDEAARRRARACAARA